MTRTQDTRLLRLVLLGILSTAVLGCGDGIKRHRIQGTVTFQGKPVEFGGIFFEPTESIGPVAPSPVVAIRQGKFDAGSEGPVAGRYVLVVGGVDQSNTRVDDGITYKRPLFQDYRFEVEIPPPGNTLDIEVPESQALKKP